MNTKYELTLVLFVRSTIFIHIPEKAMLKTVKENGKKLGSSGIWSDKTDKIKKKPL